MHIVVWILALLALAAWSLTAWGLHALLALDPGWVGDLKPLIDQIPYGSVIEAWVPGWQELLRASMDLAQTMLGWLGGIGPVVVWIVWGLGALAILALGALGSGIVALVRSMRGGAGGPRAGTPAAR